MEDQMITSTIMTDVPEFIEKYVDSKTVTFYTINVYDNFSKQKWVLEKRYSEFENLHKNLSKLLPSIPPIPGKSLFKITAYDALTKRRLQLDSFLKECNKRKDIVSNDYYKTFLELDKHSPELSFNAPEKVHSFTELPLGIRDFYYFKEENMIFIVCCDMNIASRLDAYITNVNLPWEKKTDAHISVGAVFAYSLLKGKEKGYILEKKWAKSFPEQTGVVNFDDEKNIIQVGLDTGRIVCYKSSIDSKFYSFEELCQVKPHSNRVMGVAIDTRRALIYSCSSDRKFCVTDMNNLSAITDIAESAAGYTNLFFDKKNDRIFLTNEVGMLSVFLTHTNIPTIVNIIQTHTANTIRGLEVQLKKNYIFTATNKGDISVLDLGTPGKEKLIKEISYFGGDLEIRIVRYNEENNELITGDQTGRVTIWSLKTGQSIYTWKAHEGAITQIYYESGNRILLTGGKDKNIFFWKLPERWVNEEVSKFETDEIKNINDAMAMLKFQKTLKKDDEDEDSSDDSLCGWDIRP
jgi:WD40 repeat protein